MAFQHRAAPLMPEDRRSRTESFSQIPAMDCGKVSVATFCWLTLSTENRTKHGKFEDGADVPSRRGTESAAGSVSGHHPVDAGERARVPADLAHVRLPAGGHAAPGPLHAGDAAWSISAESGDARTDRGVHVVPQRLPVLTEVARRGRGGTFEGRETGVGGDAGF